MRLQAVIERKIKNPFLQRMFVYAFSDGVSRAMPFIVLPVIANYLTPSDFGIATNFNVLVQILAAFIAFSTSFGLAVDYYKGDKGKIVSNLIYLMTLLFLFFAIVTIVASSYINQWIQLDLKWQLYALITAYFGSINQLYNTKVRYDEKAKLFGILQFLRAGTAAGFSLLFVIGFKWDWQGRIQALVFSSVIMVSISVYLFVKDDVFPKRINWSVLYSYFTFGLPLLPQTLAQWFRNGFEKVLITKQVSLADNGVYSFAGTIASIFLLFTTSFFSAYTPYMFKNLAAIEKNPELKEKIQADLIRKSYFFMIGMFSALLIGYFFVYFLIINFFNSAYHPAIIFMPFLLFYAFLSALTSMFSAYILYVKKTRALGIITMTSTIIQACITYFMVLHFKTVGAAYACVLSYLILLTILIWYSQKVYPMPWKKLFLSMLHIAKQ